MPPGLYGETAGENAPSRNGENAPAKLLGDIIGVPAGYMGVAPGPIPPNEYISASLSQKFDTTSSSSMASRTISSFSRRENEPVPAGASCPRMIFSVTPRRLSVSENAAASRRISTVSSKLHRISAPDPTRLMPCRVMAIRCPLKVITSTSIAKCL
jgi:hypothetical protein